MSRIDRITTVVALAAVGLAVAIAAIVVAATSGSTSPAHAAGSGRTITVSGDGTVRGVPDTLVADLGVDSHRQSGVQAAINAVAADRNHLVSALKGKGVPGGDIQTTDLELNSTYDDHGNVNGYDATESVSVRIHPLANVGSILSAAATSAGNAVTINGLSLDITDDAALLNAARGQAFDAARAAAERDAGLAGEHLGSVVSIKESSQSSSPPPMPYGGAAGVDSFAAASKAIAISPGRTPVTVTLAVVWTLVG
jgi:uncharacterized protein YggE